MHASIRSAQTRAAVAVVAIDSTEKGTGREQATSQPAMPPPLRRAPLHLLAVLLALLSPPGGAALQPDCREQYRHRYATEAPPAAVTAPSGAPSGAAAGAGAARGWPRPFADSAALRGAGETGYVPDSSASLQGATSDVLPALAPSPGLGGLSPRGQGRNLRQLAPPPPPSPWPLRRPSRDPGWASSSTPGASSGPEIPPGTIPCPSRPSGASPLVPPPGEGSRPPPPP